MLQDTFIIELIKNIGFPALIFAIWFFYHKANATAQEKREKQTAETFQQILNEQAKREERNFGLLKDMLETNQYHGSLLAKIAQQIEANQWCPLLKKDYPNFISKKGE